MIVGGMVCWDLEDVLNIIKRRFLEF